jgi:hypothetical protein
MWELETLKTFPYQSNTGELQAGVCVYHVICSHLIKGACTLRQEGACAFINYGFAPCTVCPLLAFTFDTMSLGNWRLFSIKLHPLSKCWLCVQSVLMITDYKYLIRLINVSLLPALNCLLDTMTTERPVDPSQRKTLTPSGCVRSAIRSPFPSLCPSTAGNSFPGPPGPPLAKFAPII